MKSALTGLMEEALQSVQTVKNQLFLFSIMFPFSFRLQAVKKNEKKRVRNEGIGFI